MNVFAVLKVKKISRVRHNKVIDKLNMNMFSETYGSKSSKMGSLSH